MSTDNWAEDKALWSWEPSWSWIPQHRDCTDLSKYSVTADLNVNSRLSIDHFTSHTKKDVCKNSYEKISRFEFKSWQWERIEDKHSCVSVWHYFTYKWLLHFLNYALFTITSKFFFYLFIYYILPWIGLHYSFSDGTYFWHTDWNFLYRYW